MLFASIAIPPPLPLFSPALLKAEMQKELAEILTDDQMKKMEQMKSEMKKRIQERMKKMQEFHKRQRENKEANNKKDDDDDDDAIDF